MAQNRSKPWAMAHAFSSKMAKNEAVFKVLYQYIHIFPKGVKMAQNRSKPWAMAHAFWSKMAKNELFLKAL